MARIERRKLTAREWAAITTPGLVVRRIPARRPVLYIYRGEGLSVEWPM
jgi:hypothetical protein